MHVSMSVKKTLLVKGDEASASCHLTFQRSTVLKAHLFCFFGQPLHLRDLLALRVRRVPHDRLTLAAPVGVVAAAALAT